MVRGLGLNKNEKASSALTLMNLSASSTWVQCDQQPHAATSMLLAMMKYTLKQWAKQTLPATAFVKCFVMILRKVDNIFMKGNCDQVRKVIWSFVSLFLPEIDSPHRQIRVFSHLHSSSRNSFKMCFRRTDAFLLNTTSSKDLILHFHYQTHPDDSPDWGGGGMILSKTFPSFHRTPMASCGKQGDENFSTQSLSIENLFRWHTTNKHLTNGLERSEN